MKSIGVISRFRLPVAPSYLKSFAFFFDEFLVTGMRKELLSGENEKFYSSECLDELNYLFDSGILNDGIVNPGNFQELPPSLVESYHHQTTRFESELQQHTKYFKSSRSDRIFELTEQIFEAKELGLNTDDLIKEQEMLASEEAKGMLGATRIFEEAARLLSRPL